MTENGTASSHELAANDEVLWAADSSVAIVPHSDEMSNEMLDAARSYLARGWSVIPLRPRDKRPAIAWEPYQHRLATEDELVAWFFGSDNNVAIVTGQISGIIALDCDSPDAAKGRELPLTPCNETSSGWHYLYTHPGFPVRNFARKLPNLDLRGDGGYVAAPPSVHPSSHVYTWLFSPDDTPIAPCPAWLLELVKTEKKAPAARVGDTIPDGQRNATLASLAGSMRRRGMTQDSIEAALLAENVRRCDPPLPDEEVRTIAKSVARYEPAERESGRPRGDHCTDLSNAERLVRTHGHNLRHCDPLGGWLAWDGRRWDVDATGEAERLAKDVVRAIYAEATECEDADTRKRLAKWAITSEGASRVRALLDLAWSEPGIPVRPEALDVNPWLLNVHNGTLDLRTGEQRPHDRQDLLTRLAPVNYDPNARDDVLDAYLATATGGDADFLAYLQRAVGYTLAGLTDEESVFLVLGPAASGKTTLVEALLGMLGDYGVKASFETFLEQRRNSGPRADLVRMRGARLVAAVEPSRGKRLAENELKEMSGGDSLTCRGMYAKWEVTYRPTFAIWLAANEAPRMHDDDDGIWRRVRRLPFEVVIPEHERDPEVKRHLRDDPEARAALLAWAVRGCLAWQREGLTSCDLVRTKTAELRADMDPIGEFLTTCCVVERQAWSTATGLRAAYEDWARESGAKPINNRSWGKRLKALGCESDRRTLSGTKTTVWIGIGLRSDQEEQEELPF